MPLPARSCLLPSLSNSGAQFFQSKRCRPCFITPRTQLKKMFNLSVVPRNAIPLPISLTHQKLPVGIAFISQRQIVSHDIRRQTTRRGFGSALEERINTPDVLDPVGNRMSENCVSRHEFLHRSPIFGRAGVMLHRSAGHRQTTYCVRHFSGKAIPDFRVER